MNTHHLFATMIALVIFAAVAFVAPQPAAASGGNVQIRLYSTSGSLIKRAEIGGYNQYGSYAVWGPYDTSSREVKATGWWFGQNGNAPYVNIRFRLDNGVTMSCFQALNIYPWDNWKTINIDSKGYTTSSGAPSGRCANITGF